MAVAAVVSCAIRVQLVAYCIFEMGYGVLPLSARGVRDGCCSRMRACCRLGRPCGSGERGERLAAPFAGSRREPGSGSPRVLGLPGGPGGEDALVADDEQRR